MAISTTQSRIQYQGNGATTIFSFPYLFFQNTDIVVTLFDTSTNVATILAYGSQYTVTGAGNAGGGSVTLATAPTNTQFLTIQRIVQLTQPDVYNPNDALNSATLMGDLDKRAMAEQQINDLVGRSLAFPPTDALTLSPILPPSTVRAGKQMVFDANGVPTVTNSAVIGMYRGQYAAGVVYNYGDTIFDEGEGDLYIALKQYTSISIVTDLAAGDIILLFDASEATEEAQEAAAAAAASATTATNAQTASAASATAAAASATAAAAAVITGEIRTFAIPSAPSGWLLADGSAVSRVTYPTLFAALVTNAGFASQTFTVTIASPGVFTKATHGFNGNERIRLSTTGALPTGLNTTTDYYVLFLTTSTFSLAVTPSGTAIATTGTQGGTHSYIQSLYGLGDGSTTFNVPNLSNQFLRGTATGRTLGTSQLDAFQGHVHGSTSSNSISANGNSVTITVLTGPNSTVDPAADSHGNGTPRTAAETRPLNVALLVCIKT